MKLLRTLYLTLSASLLSACYTITDPAVTRLPEWQPPQNHPTFGPWLVINCQLEAHTYDFTAHTDGKIENGNLLLRFRTTEQLPYPPRLSLNTLPTLPLYTEGVMNNFNMQLPVNATTTNAMQHHGAYLFFIYRTDLQMPEKQAFLETRGLLEAWQYLRSMSACQ